ncbi:MAG: GGDEF domain-containing protein [Pseudomonadota bacterium]
MSLDLGTMIFDVNKFTGKDFEKKVPVLTYLSGNQVGRRIMLAEDRITLGRAPEATILLRDPLVSRLHLAVDFDRVHCSYFLKDLGSSNGTFLNGIRITEATLKDLDKLLIGNTMLRFGWSDMFDLQYQAEIDNLLNIDELTGLVVKRRFDEELNRYLAVALSKSAELTMIMIDIDGVKQINDTYGHSFGAYTIAQTGKLIKTVIEHTGLASRFGGDEFMVFIPNLNKAVGQQIAETIRQQVETHLFEMEGVVLRPTVSIGVSNLKLNDTVASLFKRADDALYQSKRTGRNKVSISV